MKQYFIGINKCSQELLIGLLDLGATLMFRWHPKTMELNHKFEFYDGEWLLYTDCYPDTGLNEIKAFLENMKRNDSNLKYETVFV